MMKNTFIKVVTKFHHNAMLQRKDIVNLFKKVAKQWKLRCNGHSTYVTEAAATCCISRHYMVLSRLLPKQLSVTKNLHLKMLAQ